ncbi:MAG: thioredoxin domain-containing protein [Candidatus Magasanikbacteria bacterium]|nr:thioredoxin domain-containing protein [Candidatus Magasanikbacteria bacterium]
MDMDIENKNLTKKERRELKRQAKLERKDAAVKSQSKQRALVWGTVVVVVAGVLYGLIKLSASLPDAPSAPLNSGESVAALPPVLNTENILGNLAASTTFIEYSDFQCPACANAEPFVKDLISEFQTEVRFVYRYFPLPSHKFGQLSAEVAEAAARQGKFWEMHDKLFATQQAWSNSNNARAMFTGFAQELGLNMDRFNKDLTSAEVKSTVLAQLRGGEASGVNSTPSFFLNGRKLELRSFNDLRTAVQEALNK